MIRPYVDPDLVTFLESHYPDKLPEKDLPIEEIRRLQGQQDVVRYLREAADHPKNSPFQE